MLRQHLLQLGRGHMVGAVAQPTQDGGKLGREHVAGIHRDHLPQLHRRAAQVRQLIRDAGDVGWREQQVTICGRSPFASRRAPSAITPPATPPASLPKTPSRESRPLGTTRLLLSKGWSLNASSPVDI